MDSNVEKLVKHMSLLLDDDSLKLENLVQTVLGLMEYLEMEFEELKGEEKKELLLKSIKMYIAGSRSPKTSL